MRKDCVVHVPTQNDWDYVTKDRKQCGVGQLDVQSFPRDIQDYRILTIQELADLLKEMTNEL